MRIMSHAYENNASCLRETFGIVITKKSLPFVYTKEETLLSCQCLNADCID